MYLTTLDTTDESRACVLTSVNAERNRQEAMWGQQNHGDFIWNAILGEEVGEVSKSLNEQDGAEHLIEELVQVAAVCVSWVEAIRRRLPWVADCVECDWVQTLLPDHLHAIAALAAHTEEVHV